MVSEMSFVTFMGAMWRHGLRSLARGGMPFVFGTLTMAVCVWLLGTYGVVVAHVEHLSQRVSRSVAAAVFLNVESAAAAEEVRATFALDPRVASAKLISPEDALARARQSLGTSAKAFAGTAGVTMPWVVEVTPRIASPHGLGTGDPAHAAIESLLKTLGAVPGVDEVMHPSAELTRIELLLGTMHGAGLLLFVVLALVALIAVTNASQIAVFQRREEIVVLRLLGASSAFVHTPFVLTGFVQGTLGALVGVAAIAAAHTWLEAFFREAFSSPAGLSSLAAVPWHWSVALVAGGGLLAAVGAWLAAFRHGRP